VDVALEQMVFAEASTVAPVIVSDVYHRRAWEKRPRHRYGDMFGD
jgi:deoxyhypusine synthase